MLTKPKKDPTLRRKYSQRTIKILFGLSKNQCAFPDCVEPVILDLTNKSDSQVSAQICHIYAINEDGPRGRGGLTQTDLNSHKNLLLMCPTHHGSVDKQHETYPADLLIEWKKSHESNGITQKISKSPAYNGHFSPQHFPTDIINEKIELEINSMRKSRFFSEFNREERSMIFAKKITEGELHGGTPSVKTKGLAWCIRFLSFVNSDQANSYLAHAKTQGTCHELQIAEAFVISHTKNKQSALQILADINMPESKSAAFMIVAHHDGATAALDWINAASITFEDLDSDGKYFFLANLFELERWDIALTTVNTINNEDLSLTPVLNHMIAMAHLASAISPDLRGSVINDTPFNAVSFPLSDTQQALHSRGIAHKHFILSRDAALELKCKKAAEVSDRYALWLELRDPQTLEDGKRRLKSKFNELGNSALQLVHFGFQFGVLGSENVQAIETEIDRQIALYGGLTAESAFARFTLVFAKESPEEAAHYITQHFEVLGQYIDKKAMLTVQIQLFSKAGLTRNATDRLAIILQLGISEHENLRLEGVIAESEGQNPIEIRKEQFEQTNNLNDLANLVDVLIKRHAWEDVCHYGQILFGKTGSLQDGEYLAFALEYQGKTELLNTFINANKDLISQSPRLQMINCWKLYHLGDFLNAHAELKKINIDSDDLNYRELTKSIAVAMGDWATLNSFVTKENIHKHARTAEELIEAAALALHLGSNISKSLVVAAVEKSPNDPQILEKAYFLATREGWEDTQEISQWLQMAAELSKHDGPIQKLSLEQILKRKPIWDRQRDNTWRQLQVGAIPMFIAGNLLNKSLIEFMLFPALDNPRGTDPRRTVLIPAYNGMRTPMVIDPQCVLGIDASALITLSFLGILDRVLDVFPTIYLPHSTFSWLLEEKGNAAFHQPSRIRSARAIHALIADKSIEEFIPKAVIDGDLASQIGYERAQLIADAEKEYEDGLQRVVVCPSPIYRISSLMNEEVDLDNHSSVLSSCSAIIFKLKEKGLLTLEEESNALAYLQLHEKHWATQPEIADGAILYLDDLSVTYLLHIGVLDKLRPAGFTPIISNAHISESNQLISYSKIADQVKSNIESIRNSLNSRVLSGKIKFGKKLQIFNDGEPQTSDHPCAHVFTLPDYCDAVISDDRFMNRHHLIGEQSHQKKLITTIDIIACLVAQNNLMPTQQYELKTKLRKAGYIFVPITEDELMHHLTSARSNNSRFIEIADLKAIRENILSIRMSNWLQLPQEATWLDTTFKVFIRVLRELWKLNIALSIKKDCSRWIVDQLDIRGWAHRFEVEQANYVINTGRGAYLWVMLLPLHDAPKELADAYWEWIETNILRPISDAFPELYAEIVTSQKKWISEMANLDLEEAAKS